MSNKSTNQVAATKSFDLNRLIAQQMIQRENDRVDKIRRCEADDRRRDLESQRRDEANRNMMMQRMMMFTHGGANRAPSSLATTIAPPETAQEPDDNASVTSALRRKCQSQRRSQLHPNSANHLVTNNDINISILILNSLFLV